MKPVAQRFEKGFRDLWGIVRQSIMVREHPPGAGFPGVLVGTDMVKLHKTETVFLPLILQNLRMENSALLI
jgi:hypothetical protein